MRNIKDIIESLLFVAQEPLTIEKIKTILETAETKEIRSALDGLADQYTARGGGFFLCEVAGGWQLRSRPEFNEWIKRMLQPSPQRLTKAALETLAIVAYNQPIIRADIEHIRGVDCGGVLRQLMERKLIRVLGRKEIPGRPMIYATTKLFLELFNLKSLKDLPSPKEMEELGSPEEAQQQQPDMSSLEPATQSSEPLSVTGASTSPQPRFGDSAESGDPGYRRHALSPIQGSSPDQADTSDQPIDLPYHPPRLWAEPFPCSTGRNEAVPKTSAAQLPSGKPDVRSSR